MEAQIANDERSTLSRESEIAELHVHRYLQTQPLRHATAALPNSSLVAQLVASLH
jgi:hypothetical protein